MKRPTIAPEQLEELGEPANMMDNLLTQAADIIRQIEPFLHSKSPQVQSIVLAHLLHVWVLDHHMEPLGDPRVQQRFRERVLREHISLVRQLVQAEVKDNAKQAGFSIGRDDGSAGG
jgi:hypothetical protein